MYSIKFPDMLSSTHTNICSDETDVVADKASYENLVLLLKSNKYSLFGDPYYGTNLHRLIFEQNNQVLRDIVIDDIFTAISTFMPQVVLKRNDIEIVSSREKVYIKIKLTNLLDYTTNLYTIDLMNTEEGT